jgi:N-acetylmuramoyl-L-alanine amidase
LKGSALRDRVQASPNFEARVEGKRPTIIILHYTGMTSGVAAVDWLCNPASKVSCHYLVDVDGSIVQMVDEDQRAWHAGVSSWRGELDINSASVGIEIQNTGHAGGCPKFPDIQMQRVSALCTDIMQRYEILPHMVLAHSDVAPGRKVDPGEAFDWNWLDNRGVGQCVLHAGSDDHVALKGGDGGPLVEALQKQLSAYGYGIDARGVFDDRTRIVVEAFQRRFRRTRVDGVADAETINVLRRLVATLPLA